MFLQWFLFNWVQSLKYRNEQTTDLTGTGKSRSAAASESALKIGALSERWTVVAVNTLVNIITNDAITCSWFLKLLVLEASEFNTY